MSADSRCESELAVNKSKSRNKETVDDNFLSRGLGLLSTVTKQGLLITDLLKRLQKANLRKTCPVVNKTSKRESKNCGRRFLIKQSKGS